MTAGFRHGHMPAPARLSHQLASRASAAKQLRSPSKQQSVKAADADADAELLA